MDPDNLNGAVPAEDRDEGLFGMLSEPEFIERYSEKGGGDTGSAGQEQSGSGAGPDGSWRQDRAVVDGGEGKAATGGTARSDRRVPEPPGSSPLFGFDGPEFGGGSSGQSGGQESDPKGIPVRTPKKPPRRPPSSGKPVTVKGIPPEMIYAARAMFPNARTQTDALVAYIAFNCPDLGSKADLKRMLTKDQFDLLKECKTTEQQTMIAQLRQTGKRVLSVGGKIDRMLAAMFLIMYSQCGLLSRYPDTVLDWDHCDLDHLDEGRFEMFFDIMLRNIERYIVLRTQQSGRPPDM